jgi:predicted ATP-dependent endonuclease of OLD family
MQIKHLLVENFRGIQVAPTPIGRMTAFIGENNACKSTLLKSIDIFFGSKSKLEPNDFYNRQADARVTVTITFTALTDRDKESLSVTDDEITITREFSNDPDRTSGAYFVEAYVNPEFTPCREETKPGPKRKLYDEFREKYGLEKVTAADQIEAHLEKWEAENKAALKLERMGRLLGFTNVALGKLQEATSFHFIPAVQDASDEIGSDRGSPIRQLISQIARDTIENRKEFADFKTKANAELADLTSPEKIPSLKTISERLTDLLSRYYAQSKLHATWNPMTELPITFPTARVEVEDNNFIASIDAVGHGLQRAALFAVLEFMARSNFENKNNTKKEGFDAAHSDIIIAIEEPEIYQHPSKQRLLYDAFKAIVNGFNKETGIRVQLLYATHSNLFLQLQDTDAIRVCKRDLSKEDRPVSVIATNLQECAETVAAAKGVAPNVKKFAMGLHTFTPEIAEGFFAKTCVLVEGVSDRVILLAYYRQKDIEPLSQGIFIVSTEGKTKMDKPIVVFEKFGVPCYFLFDNDSEQKAKKQNIPYNRLLQNLAGIGDAEVVDFPAGVKDRFFALPGNLETYIRSKSSNEDYEKMLSELSVEFEVDAGDCLKSPVIASNLFNRLIGKGAQFPELDEVVSRINKLAGIAA